MKAIAKHSDGSVCERAMQSGDCPQSHRWVAPSAPVVRPSRDLDLAKHLIILRMRLYSLRNESRTKSFYLAQARYDEARVIASMLGYGATEFAIRDDVDKSVRRQGMDERVWRGRLGAEFEASWLLGAATNLVEIWNS